MDKREMACELEELMCISEVHTNSDYTIESREEVVNNRLRLFTEIHHIGFVENYNKANHEVKYTFIGDRLRYRHIPYEDYCESLYKTIDISIDLKNVVLNREGFERVFESVEKQLGLSSWKKYLPTASYLPNYKFDPKQLLNNLYGSHIFDSDARIDDVRFGAMIHDRIKNLNKSHKPTPTKTIPEIKNVLFNNPATIVFWADGTKTVVKAQDEGYDHEKGLAMAICKKALGNSSKYYDVFKKWFEEDHKREVPKKKLEIGIDDLLKRLDEAIRKCATLSGIEDEDYERGLRIKTEAVDKTSNDGSNDVESFDECPPWLM